MKEEQTTENSSGKFNLVLLGKLRRRLRGRPAYIILQALLQQPKTRSREEILAERAAD
jgi:hypothetical protein